jgi:excisionase family DNA binding protein
MSNEERAAQLEDGTLGVAEAARFTGLSKSGLYALMQRRELAYTRAGRRRLIPKRSLVELLSKNLVPARK